VARAFIFDRRQGYFDAQDIEPDHRYALMRYSGAATLLDDLEERLTRTKLFFKTRKWGGWGYSRPDRKRQKRSHRHG